jgi:hypothetical protein
MGGAFIPVWIIGAPVIAILILSFSFEGPSSMSGSGKRPDDRMVGRNSNATY